METQATPFGERDSIIHRPLGVGEKLKPCMDAMNGYRNPFGSHREKGEREKGERERRERIVEEEDRRSLGKREGWWEKMGGRRRGIR